MRRALVLAVVLAGNPVATVPVWADKPATPEEDPKQAIRDRGIVLKAGKRSYMVIVPSAELPAWGQPGSTLAAATVYFGDTKTLFEMDASNGTSNKDSSEHRSVHDHPRVLNSGTLWRRGERYELVCEDQIDKDNRRTFPLKPVDAKTAASVAKAALRPLNMSFAASMLARIPGETTYVYVDKNLAKNSKEYRLFVGKQGAMKRIAVKESAVDSKALVIVTAKATLTATFDGKGQFSGATWGSAKQPAALDVIPTHPNRALIYRDLGVYTKERTGHPCYEL